MDSNARLGTGTPPPIEELFGLMRAASRSDLDPPLALRQDRLRRLGALLQRHAVAFEVAIDADFGHRSRHETRLLELLVVEAGVKHARRHVGRWMRTKRVPTQLHFQPGRNRLLPQPLGVVGIISPWNYPLQLSLAPAVGALAAGNRVMIKPSEFVPQFGAVLDTAIREFFDPAEMVVVRGDVDVAQAFADLPFDHLLFTGSTRVGRLVAERAARNLTPVTLELGGKSPAIIDLSADLPRAAERIALGKLLNAGQTCVAPDYVLCPRGLQDEFCRLYLAAAARLYGPDPANPDYTAIINSVHYERLEALLADAAERGAQIVWGPGRIEAWRAKGKFPACLVLRTKPDMRVRQEEIFGPILPIVTYEDVGDAIAQVNAGERPLALYWFGIDRAAGDKVLRGTLAGGVTVNDCLTHLAQEHQPFGGVGASGTGSYHGERGFRNFSKEKPIFYQPRLRALDLLRPPYGARFDRVLRLVRQII